MATTTAVGWGVILGGGQGCCVTRGPSLRIPVQNCRCKSLQQVNKAEIPTSLCSFHLQPPLQLMICSSRNFQ